MTQEAPHNNLIQTTGLGMWIVDRCCARGRYVFEAFDTPPLLDVIREISACAELDDEVYVAFALLWQAVKLNYKSSETSERRTTMSNRRVICR